MSVSLSEPRNPLADSFTSLDDGHGVNKTVDKIIEKSISLVFIDGYFVADQSDLDLLPKEVLLCPFNVVVNWLKGIFIYIPKHCSVTHPIHLKFQNSCKKEASCYLYNTIVIEENSNAIIVEEYSSSTNTPRPSFEKTNNAPQKYVMHSATEIQLDKNASLEFYKVQDDSSPASHHVNIDIHQKEGSHANLFFADCGAYFSETQVNIQLQEPYARCDINGLYRTFCDGQSIHNKVYVDHVAEYSVSSMQFKGILDKKSRAEFIGKVTVHENAQHINAHQSNHNLLLSDNAEVKTNPELEIYADDVKCSHGATIGQIDEEALFYLRSRGIEKHAAYEVLVEAFADDIIDKIKNKIIQQYVKERMRKS
jgi:Fe-S cluster assembly protein SufD